MSASGEMIMINVEKYGKEIEELDYVFAVDKSNKKLIPCGEIPCGQCKFYDGDACATRRSKWLCEEYKKPILDEVEKSYLEHVIRPFKYRIDSVAKEFSCYNDNSEYIAFYIDNQFFYLPDFKMRTKYKGMKLYKKYTLQELGLFEGEEK